MMKIYNNIIIKLKYNLLSNNKLFEVCFVVNLKVRFKWKVVFYLGINVVRNIVFLELLKIEVRDL